MTERRTAQVRDWLKRIRKIENRAGEFGGGLSHNDQIRWGNLVFMFLKIWEESQGDEEE